jgi:hypothetical protein
MSCQLIVFIDPVKFGGLVGNDSIPNYKAREGDRSNYLNDSQSIVYVYPDDRIEVGRFKPNLTSSAKVILVPDTCREENFEYVPKTGFKILFHGKPGSGSADKIAKLRKSVFFRGQQKSIEEPNTPYQVLADAIRSKSLVSELPRLLAQIPSFDAELDAELEAKLELLDTMLKGEAPSRTLIGRVKKSSPNIEKELKDFNKVPSDRFSPDYHAAYSKLRHSLKID